METMRDNQTASEILINSGLNWEAVRSPLYDVNGRELKDYKEIRRSDNGETLHVASNRYMPFQNREILGLVDEFTGTGLAKYQKAGMYKGGKRVYFRVAVPNTNFEPVKGDVVQTFLDIYNSNDGTSALYIIPKIERLVCSNGMTAMTKDATRRVSARHTQSGRRVFCVDARRILADEIAYFNQYAKRAGELAQKEMGKLELESFLFDLFKNEENEITGKNYKTMQKIQYLSNRGVGQDIEGVRGTAWGVFNGVTEYIDHYSKKEGEDREVFSSFGSGAELREKAFALLSR